MCICVFYLYITEFVIVLLPFIWQPYLFCYIYSVLNLKIYKFLIVHTYYQWGMYLHITYLVNIVNIHCQQYCLKFILKVSSYTAPCFVHLSKKNA